MDEGGTRRTVAALVVAVVAFAAQQTAIVPAIHDVQVSLHSSHEWASWLVTVYLMVATVATPALGRLADLHGRRRMLLVGLGIFALASVGAALAPNMAVLIVFRAVQGAGGVVYPLTLALARDRVPPERSSRAISLLTGAFGAGTALGLVGGGLLAEYVSWRAVFAVGAVLVAAAAVAVARRSRCWPPSPWWSPSAGARRSPSARSWSPRRRRRTGWRTSGGQTSTLLLASLLVAGSTRARFEAYRASYLVAAG